MAHSWFPSSLPFRTRLVLTRRIAVVAAPLVLQNLSFTLLGVADTFFVSRISTDAVAAVGLAGILYFALLLLFRSAASSSMVFVGRAHGSADAAGIGRSVWRVLTMAGLLALLTPALPWVYGALFGLAAPADAETVRTLGTQYLHIRSLEVPFVMFSAVVWGFMVGRGDTRTPMWLAWGTVAANIVLDAALVLGPGPFPAWGVAGAALATVLANVATAGVSAWLLWRPEMHRRYATRTPYRPTRAELGATLRVGLPMGIGDFVEVASFSVFFMILARVGVEALAASQIALQYMSLSFTMGFAIAMAAGSMVAQSLGAGNAREAEGVGYRATTLAAAAMGLVGLGYLIAPEALIGVFSDDPAVIAGGATVLRLVAFYQLFDAVSIVLGGALNGAGDTTFTMLVRIFLGWGGFLPVAWLFALPLGGGVLGAWIGALAYLSLRGLVYFLRFRSGRWKRLRLA